MEYIFTSTSVNLSKALITKRQMELNKYANKIRIIDNDAKKAFAIIDRHKFAFVQSIKSKKKEWWRTDVLLRQCLKKEFEQVTDKKRRHESLKRISLENKNTKNKAVLGQQRFRTNSGHYEEYKNAIDEESKQRSDSNLSFSTMFTKSFEVLNNKLEVLLDPNIIQEKSKKSSQKLVAHNQQLKDTKKYEMEKTPPIINNLSVNNDEFLMMMKNQFEKKVSNIQLNKHLLPSIHLTKSILVHDDQICKDSKSLLDQPLTITTNLIDAQNTYIEDVVLLPQMQAKSLELPKLENKPTKNFDTDYDKRGENLLVDFNYTYSRFLKNSPCYFETKDSIKEEQARKNFLFTCKIVE
jgi:hypothetical protein